MPSVSKAQAGFMAMSKSPAGRAILRKHGKKPAPEKVASDYEAADKGRKTSKLPRHVLKK